MNRFIFRLTASDAPGIIYAVSGAIVSARGNIVESSQFADDSSGSFNARVVFESPETRAAILEELTLRLRVFDPVISLRESKTLRRALIMVSNLDHCLDDILYRLNLGELPIEVPLVVSNHETLRRRVEDAGIPFAHLAVTPDSKEQAEAQLIDLVEEHHIDFIVLARYMQILSESLCARYSGRIINIHHSFLPSFKGAKPYHQAHKRGVKIIGATAHYVTADLDEGPIIEQDVTHVSHRQDAAELVVMGRDIERRVLSRAVKFHAEDRVFLNGARTVVLS